MTTETRSPLEIARDALAKSEAALPEAQKTFADAKQAFADARATADVDELLALSAKVRDATVAGEKIEKSIADAKAEIVKIEKASVVNAALETVKDVNETLRSAFTAETIEKLFAAEITGVRYVVRLAMADGKPTGKVEIDRLPMGATPAPTPRATTGETGSRTKFSVVANGASYNATAYLEAFGKEYGWSDSQLATRLAYKPDHTKRAETIANKLGHQVVRA